MTGRYFASGPQCMIGYHNKPEQTKEVIVEMKGMRGVRTGDRGRLDDDGFLFITADSRKNISWPTVKYIHPDTIELEMKVLNPGF